MKLISRTVLVALMWVASAAAAEPLASISLPASVALPAGAVTLGDVAEIKSESLPLVERLVAVPLGRAPRMGETVVVSRAEIEAWLKPRVGVASGAIAWSGAESVVVSAAQREVPAAELADTARRALAEWLAARATRYEISAAEVRPIAVPVGKLRLAARPLAATDTPRSRMQVWVEVWVEEQFIRVVPVSFAVDAHAVALVASADTPVGGQALLEPKEVPLSRKPSAQPANTAPLRARSNLKAGEAVSNAQVESQPAVARGQRAKMLSVAGAVRIESSVDVLQDGAPGQTVRVRLPAAAGVISARVVQPGVVEMMQ